MLGNVSSSEPIERLSPKQEMLIAILCSGISIVAAAANTGITEQTAHKWLKLPHFQRGYKAAQKNLFDQALTGLMLKTDKAINTLNRNMDSEDAPPSTQIRAAQIVLEQAIAINKMSELEQEVAELKRLLQQSKTWQQ